MGYPYWIRERFGNDVPDWAKDRWKNDDDFDDFEFTDDIFEDGRDQGVQDEREPF